MLTGIYVFRRNDDLQSRCQIRYLRKVDGPIIGLNPVLFNVHNPELYIQRSGTCLVMFQNIFLKETPRKHNLDVETVTPTSNSWPFTQKLAIFLFCHSLVRTASPPSFFLNGISGNHGLEMMILTMTVIIHFNLVRTEDYPSHQKSQSDYLTELSISYLLFFILSVLLTCKL